jgi:hypothetical protein
VDKLEMGRVLTRVILFVPVKSIPPTIHLTFTFMFFLPAVQMITDWQPSKKQLLYQNSGVSDKKIPSDLCPLDLL